MEPVPVVALVDTHAVIWSVQVDARLGVNAARFIRTAEPGSLAIADMTLLEIAMLIEKKRIGVTGKAELFLQQLESVYHVYRLNAAIAHSAVKLPLPQADPFDRSIVATALYHKLPLISRDHPITQSGCVETIW